MLRLSRKKPSEPLDFAQIIGSCSRPNSGSAWDNINLADATKHGLGSLVDFYIDFHRDLLRKENMDGLLEPSASLANQRALELAREKTGKDKVLCTNLSHSSIVRACRLLKLEPLEVDLDASQGYQAREEEIAKIISRHGKDIASVVSTYGTTQLGHIERLTESGAVKQLREDGAWLHVDAAYGSYVGQLSEKVKNKVPDCDSITIDPYKFAGKPGVALLLMNKDRIPKPNFVYYNHTPYTFHTTLSAGPVAAWANTLKDYGGIFGLRDLANDCVKIAERSAEKLRKKGVSLIHGPEMSIVPVALRSTEETAYVHKTLLNEGYSVGKIYIKGKDYETNGIRIVITPKVNPMLVYGAAMRLSDNIIRLTSKISR